MSNQPTSWNIQQINNLRFQARTWRIGTAVAIFAISGSCLAYLYSSATKLTRPGSERDVFVAEFKNGLTTEVVPQAQRLAKRTWSQLVPAVQTEVVKLHDRYPELADGVQRELELLTVNLPARAEVVLNETVGDMIRQRESTIRGLYGEITPEQLDRIKLALLAEGERRAGSLADFLAKPFDDTVQKIMTDLNQITATTSADVTLPQQAENLTTLLAQLTQDQLQATAAQLSATLPQPTLAEVK